jgi:hypothetical protein
MSIAPGRIKALDKRSDFEYNSNKVATSTTCSLIRESGRKPNRDGGEAFLMRLFWRVAGLAGPAPHPSRR